MDVFRLDRVTEVGGVSHFWAGEKRGKNGAEGAVFEIFFGVLEKFVNKNAIKSDFCEKSGSKNFSRNFSKNVEIFSENFANFRNFSKFFRKFLEFSKNFLTNF